MQIGFTLIELLIVIAIIGLLASIILTNLAISRAKARDVQRKANLVELQKALELYFSDNSAYPIGDYYEKGECASAPCTYSGPNGWIPNLAPQYIAVLPSDPLAGHPIAAAGCANGTGGYYYISDGTNYKIKDYCTVEEPVDVTDPFRDPAGRTYTYAMYSPGGAGW